MTRIIHPEFRDQQDASRYPFSDTALLTALSGATFGPETFIDASIYPVGGAYGAYISKINIDNDVVTITVGDAEATDRAAVTFDPISPPAILQLLDGYGRPAGALIGDATRLAVFQTWPLGDHTFEQAQTEFAASTVIPVPTAALEGLQTEAGDVLTGDVWIVGDAGVVVREDNGAIRVDIVGDPLFRRRICAPPSLFTTPNFVRTVNGLGPNEFGDLQIAVENTEASDTLLRVYPENGAVVIEAVGQKVEH